MHKSGNAVKAGDKFTYAGETYWATQDAVGEFDAYIRVYTDRDGVDSEIVIPNGLDVDIFVAPDMNPEIRLRPDSRDPAETHVLWSKARYKIGNVRERYTPERTYDAYRNGMLVYSGADTLERAAQAVADYSTNPVGR